MTAFHTMTAIFPQDLTDCLPVEGMKFPTGRINGLHSDITANVCDLFPQTAPGIRHLYIKSAQFFSFTLMCKPKHVVRYRWVKDIPKNLANLLNMQICENAANSVLMTFNSGQQTCQSTTCSLGGRVWIVRTRNLKGNEL